MANLTKRGMFQQRDPDEDVANLSALLFHCKVTWKSVAERAVAAGYPITVPTISKIAYMETRTPRNSTRAAILAGLGAREQWVLPDGVIWERLSKDEATSRWYAEQGRPKKVAS